MGFRAIEKLVMMLVGVRTMSVSLPVETMDWSRFGAIEKPRKKKV